jgi:molybdopterin-guanine dinucleotide biosynthesis protein MobB
MKYNVAVIKNVSHHPVDNEGKDSYKFTKAGAIYSVIHNIKNETAIFMREYDNNLRTIQDWLKKGSYKIDLLFTEGYRNLNNPTVLCISNLNEIDEQLTENTKMITGIICQRNLDKNSYLNLPIIDIDNNFSKFVELFNLI